MENGPFIFCGRASYGLAQAIAKELSVEFNNEEVNFEAFADEEPWYQIPLPIRDQVEGKNVFLIQSTPQPAVSTYFDSFGLLDSLKRGNPAKLVLVMPFMGFRRQERDKYGGEAIMAELMARLICEAGATEAILCDPHSPKVPTYFPIPTHVVNANEVFQEALSEYDLSNYVVLSPDEGREQLAYDFAERLGLMFASGDKTRPDHDQVDCVEIDGDVMGKNVIIREDEISTASTISKTIAQLKRCGALKTLVIATHGILAGGAIQLIKKLKNDLIKVMITDSIDLSLVKRKKGIQVISLDKTLARVIKKIHLS